MFILFEFVNVKIKSMENVICVEHALLMWKT